MFKELKQLFVGIEENTCFKNTKLNVQFSIMFNYFKIICFNI